MKKTFLVAYLLIAVVVFFIGLRSLHAKPGDMVFCSNFFPDKANCKCGGCVQTDSTRNGECKIVDCSGGCKMWDDKGNCLVWIKQANSCSCGSGGGGGGAGFDDIDGDYGNWHDPNWM